MLVDLLLVVCCLLVGFSGAFRLVWDLVCALQFIWVLFIGVVVALAVSLGFALLYGLRC